MASYSTLRARHACISAMMERLGIDAGVGVLPRWSVGYATALHRCESCAAKPACQGWLNARRGPAVFAPRFCANADLFLEMQFDQLAHEPFAHAPARV